MLKHVRVAVCAYNTKRFGSNINLNSLEVINSGPIEMCDCIRIEDKHAVRRRNRSKK